MIPAFPNDRDYFYDEEENIYQVIGYVHPSEAVYCLLKYVKILDAEPIKDRYLWRSHLTHHYYERNIPTYSSKTASDIIKQHRYRTFSLLYGTNFISYPKKKITNYLEPRKKLLNLQKQVQTEFTTLSDQERYAIEVSYLFEKELGIDTKNVGVTGSILWQGVHADSDIDIIIYGISNMRRFFNSVNKLLYSTKQFRLPSLTEQMNWAGKFSQKSGLSLEDCTVSIIKKKFLLFFSKYFLSIAFNPLEEEIQRNSLAEKNSIFINSPDFTRVTIQATVADDDWMYFYPGVVYLKNVRIIEPFLSTKSLRICRLIVFEHENIGYYEKGDEIEIRGLVQLINNPPFDVAVKCQFFKETDDEKIAQIIVGTSENFGNEYVKNLRI